MTRRFRTFLTLLGVLIALVLVSNLWGDFKSGDFQANLLRIQGGPELSARKLSGVNTLETGDFAPVYRFQMRALQPYTVRYLGMNVESKGLDSAKLGNARQWKLYSDGSERVLVGEGEAFEGDLLRVRLFSNSTSAYFLEPGKTDFLVTAPVKILDASGTKLKVGLADDAWLLRSGHFEGPWLSTNDVLYEEAVNGLPTDLLELQADL